MAAAAYKVVLAVKNSKNQTTSIPLTASDVNGEFWLFPSGGSEIPISQNASVVYDIVYTAAGTDTSQVEIFLNGVSTGRKLFNSANLGTVYNRQSQSSPLQIPPGATVKFKQLT